MSGPQMITLGCRLNIAESEAMQLLAAEQDDLVIVNSCAVTQEAVRQTRKAVRQAARSRPGARIVVTGCAAQIEPAGFAAMPEVWRVLGNREKLEAGSFGGTGGGVAVSDIFAHRTDYAPVVTRPANHARAFVEVQNGCDHRCTFCVIPFGRGDSRSAPAGDIIDGIAKLVDGGCREVVLTGVDLTSYAATAGDSLGRLVERILTHVPALDRLRLSSLDPVEVDDRLFALIAGERRVMPHLHLSLQAGDDMILKRMKRRHSRAQAIDLVARVKAARPEVAIGADIIAGFPTESEAMFAQSLAIVEACDIVFGHIFPYSPRSGTPAARMPQLEREVIKARAKRLRKACAERQARWLSSLIGTTQRVLLERGGRTGHAENFARVVVHHPGESRDDGGSLIALRITGVEDATLIGVPA